MSKTIKLAIADTLEDLSKQDFEKFCHQLLDRREEPRVRRCRVEGKNFLDITDVLVSTFTEAGALRVALEILRRIDCNHEAQSLGTKGPGLVSTLREPEDNRPILTRNTQCIETSSSSKFVLSSKNGHARRLSRGNQKL
ncbi:hypothetical protein Q8A73_007607 [Channa argus]|nr:hypothetical protein Q8A73_007607 [Channa argus]